MSKRERLLIHLIHLRELHLKSQTAQLKTTAQHLREVRECHQQARSAAARALEDARGLADLAHLGAARIRHARLAAQVETEVRALSEKVGHARKLADSAHDAAAELRRDQIIERERSMENEAEQFFNWSKVFGR